MKTASSTEYDDNPNTMINMVVASLMIPVLFLLVRGIIGYISNDVIIEEFGITVMTISAFLSTFTIKYLSAHIIREKYKNIISISIIAIYCFGIALYVCENFHPSQLIVILISSLNYLPFLPKKWIKKIPMMSKLFLVMFFIYSLFLIMVSLHIFDLSFNIYGSASILSSSIISLVLSSQQTTLKMKNKYIAPIIFSIIIIIATFIFTYSSNPMQYENMIKQESIVDIASSGLLFNIILVSYKKINRPCV